ncbi:MAG: outer membrane beta-barrel protein [Bacteroidales bacterium]
MEKNNQSTRQNHLSGLSLFTLSVILILNLISARCNAQAALLVFIFGDKIATEKFHTSIDAGLNFASFNGLDPAKARPGLYFGLGTFLKLNDKWAFVPEFKPLSQRSLRKAPALLEYINITDPTYGLQLNYIDIPIMFQYKITPHFFVSAGPQISFLTSADQIVNGVIAQSENDVEIVENRRSDFNSMYFCLPVEVGYSLPEVIPGQGIDLKVRYDIGFNNVIKTEAYGSSSINCLQLMLSFPFIEKSN